MNIRDAKIKDITAKALVITLENGDMVELPVRYYYRSYKEPKKRPIPKKGNGRAKVINCHPNERKVPRVPPDEQA